MHVFDIYKYKSNKNIFHLYSYLQNFFFWGFSAIKKNIYLRGDITFLLSHFNDLNFGILYVNKAHDDYFSFEFSFYCGKVYVRIKKN